MQFMTSLVENVGARAPFMLQLSSIQGDLTECRTGNGEKLSSNQAEPGQPLGSAHQISCCLVSLHFLCDTLSGRPVE